MKKTKLTEKPAKVTSLFDTTIHKPEHTANQKFVESRFEEVKVPRGESYILKILPELKALKEKIDRIISDHISSITSQKLQSKILQKLQGELFE